MNDRLTIDQHRTLSCLMMKRNVGILYESTYLVAC